MPTPRPDTPTRTGDAIAALGPSGAAALRDAELAALVEHGLVQECRIRSAGGPRVGERIDASWDALFTGPAANGSR